MPDALASQPALTVVQPHPARRWWQRALDWPGRPRRRRPRAAGGEEGRLPTVLVDGGLLELLGTEAPRLLPPEAEAGPSGAHRAETSRAKTILVVDDEPSVRRLLEQVLRFEGYRVELAANGAEALFRLGTSDPPDALVLDLEMPRMGGLELCRRLRGAGNRIPILVVTGAEEGGARRAALHAGADDFLAKPLELPELRRRVQALLGGAPDAAA